MDGIVTKYCTKCKQVKPLTDFYSVKASWCKSCILQDRKEKYVPKPPKHPPVPEGHKWCSRCQQTFAATAEFFYSNKSKPDELSTLCKTCHHEYEQIRIQQKPRKPLPEMFVCAKCNEEKPATREYFPASKTSPYGLDPTCKTCRNTEKREYYHTHPEFRKRLAEYEKGFTPEKRERRRASAREWRHANSQRQLAYKRIYRKLPHVRAYRRTENHKRRARLMQAPGSHTSQDIQLQYKRQKGRCYWCGTNLKHETRPYHVDHVIPLSRGGSNWPDNLVIACHTCNESRNNKLPHEWPRGGRLL